MSSQFFFDPNSYSVNNSPSDIFAADSLGSGTINSFTIQNDGTNNYLEIDATVDSNESTAYLKYIDLPVSTDTEVFLQYKVTEAVADRGFFTAGSLRIPETSITSSDFILNGYNLEGQFSATSISTDQNGTNSIVNLIQSTAPSIGDFVNIRFSTVATPEDVGDNLATMSYWIDGTDESTAIQVTYSFANTSPGVAGIGLIPLPRGEGASIGLNDKIQIYKFSVATEGAQAPTEPLPVSSQSYSVIGVSVFDITSNASLAYKSSIAYNIVGTSTIQATSLATTNFKNVPVARSIVGDAVTNVNPGAVVEYDQYLTYTAWQAPRLSQELESEEISFNKVPRSSQYVSAKPISSTSNYFGGRVTKESSAIAFTDLRLDPGEKDVIGVEVFLHISRLGRTQDKAIKLFSEKTIGKNLADLEAEDKNTYSGDLKTWGIDKLSVDFTATTFGVSVDLQPHTQYPSNEIVYIRKVQVRLILGRPI